MELIPRFPLPGTPESLPRDGEFYSAEVREYSLE